MLTLRECRNCHKFWESAKTPFCPNCLAYDWENLPHFLKEKHDPRTLPHTKKEFRKFHSVVTMEFVTNPKLFIQTITQNGYYYFDPNRNNYSCAMYQALGNVSGSALPSGFMYPVYPLDSLFIADVFGKAHIYAVDRSEIISSIAIGRLIPSQKCSFPNCFNLSIPGTNRCAIH
jgi:hypothetical protein